MDIMSTRQKKYHQGKVIIPKAAVPILRLFDEDHESSESGYAVPVGSTRWTAREESLCCSFLQKQMQTSPNDKKDQLLRATSVYLVTEGYFPNPERIYTHLWERARHLGSQGAYVSRTKKQDNLITSTWEALRASRTSLPQPLRPLVVSQAAESLVRQAYQDVNAASNGVHSWHQYRTHAHYLVRFGTYDGDAEEIDSALLGLYETTSLKYCDTCSTRCIKAGQCRKCNPIKCVSCGGNTPSWLTECRRCNDKAKRPRGRTRSGADQNRCIDRGVAQNGKQRICPTCLLAMERRMEKENSSNADANRRPRRFRRPEHQLGDRLCCDCKKPVPPERRRCQQCQEKSTTRRRVEDSELKKAKRRAEAERCVDCGVKFLPFPGESIRCASCLKRHEARLAAKAICSDCGPRGRVGKKRCEVCQKVCVKRRAQNAERARKKRRHTRLITNAVFCLDWRTAASPSPHKEEMLFLSIYIPYRQPTKKKSEKACRPRNPATRLLRLRRAREI